MVKPIFTWIMIDLSEYLNVNFPGEKFAILMDNASSHDLLHELPYDNLVFVMLPPNCTVKGINFNSSIPKVASDSVGKIESENILPQSSTTFLICMFRILAFSAYFRMVDYD